MDNDDEEDNQELLSKLKISKMEEVNEISLTHLINTLESELKDNNFLLLSTILSLVTFTSPPSRVELSDCSTKLLQLSNLYFDNLYSNLLIPTFLLTSGSLIEYGAIVEKEASNEFVKILRKIFSQKVDEEFFNIVSSITPSCQHFLSKFYSARETIRNDETIIEKINEIRYKRPEIKMLHTLLEVFDDEEVLVIDFETKQGFIVETSGCSDNMQFQTLLADILIPTYLKGCKPSKEIVDCLSGIGKSSLENVIINSNWNMYNWVSIIDNEELNQNECKYWVWNEGIPNDIAKFKDIRVLVLGKQILNGKTIQRSFNCCRVFEPLKASVKLVEKLDEKIVKEYIDHFVNASKKKRNKAIDYILSRTVFIDDEEMEKANDGILDEFTKKMIQKEIMKGGEITESESDVVDEESLDYEESLDNENENEVDKEYILGENTDNEDDEDNQT